MRAGFASAALGPLGGYKVGRHLASFDWIILALSGVLLAIHWLAFLASVQMAGVAVATLTFATFPLFTVLLEAILRRRLPRPAEIAVGIVIIIAVALLVKPSGGTGNVLGSTVGLASAISYALFWRVAQGVRATLPPLAISFYQNLAVLAFLFPALPCGAGRHQCRRDAVALFVRAETHLRQHMQRVCCTGAGLCRDLRRLAVRRPPHAMDYR